MYLTSHMATTVYVTWHIFTLVKKISLSQMSILVSD